MYKAQVLSETGDLEVCVLSVFVVLVDLGY